MSLSFQLCAIPLLALTTGVITLILRAKRLSLKFLQGPPRPSLLLGHEWEMGRARKVGSLEDSWFEQYGYVFKLGGCYGEDILMVADPRGLQHIFHKSAYRYIKPADIEHATTKLFGPGLATVNGETHSRQRKLLNPAFSAAQIRPFAQVFSLAAQSLTVKWRAEIEGGKEVLDTVRYLPNMTLDALGESFFGYEFGAMEGKKSSELCDIIRDLFTDSVASNELQMLRRALYRFSPNWVLQFLELQKTKQDRRFEHWLSASRAVAGTLVKTKMESGDSVEKDNDIMSILSRALYTNDPEKSLSSEEALSQMATIIFAGHETSASSLNWILYELARHPEYQEKIYQEIKDLREQTRNEQDLSSIDVEGLTYLNAVIKESLRLHPIVPELVRQAEVDDVIPLDYPIIDASGAPLNAVPVVKGQRVVVSIAQYNRLKEVWGEDADEYNPERFVNIKTPTTLGVFGNLMTFSGGIRGCIGWRFAVLEIQVVLAALVESFVFSTPEGIEMDEVRVGLSVPMIKGSWKEGSKMPLKFTLRQD
ncbi:hypothetical protein PQX77_017631 [Marasmius sp. AFHP31]|nr:hypothetical protein PQX77_017631 [Marasmius sp. AFHP31]